MFGPGSMLSGMLGIGVRKIQAQMQGCAGNAWYPPACLLVKLPTLMSKEAHEDYFHPAKQASKPKPSTFEMQS